MKLRIHRSFKSIKDWRKFKSTVKRTKQMFFDNKIHKIVLRNLRLWDIIK